MGIINHMPKVIEAVYEDGVFKPLQKVELKEGEKVKLRIEKNDYTKYFGVFGKSSISEMKKYEEEVFL